MYCVKIDHYQKCADRGEWPPGARDFQMVGASKCQRVFPYRDAPCNDAALWAPPTHVESDRCLVKKVLNHAYRRAPCNNPFLPAYIHAHPENVTVEVVNTTTVIINPPQPTVGQLLALRLASKVYTVADFFYMIDAFLMVVNWVRYNQRRSDQHDKHGSKSPTLTALHNVTDVVER
jgi:hypothetical protein